MSKKESLRNKVFKSVKDKLEYVQKECPETELFEDLKQLFKSKGFENVKITHGTSEFGKDLIFSIHDDAFNEDKWYAVIVKNKSASQNDFMEGHEIGDQIKLALTVQLTDVKGKKSSISGLFIVINGTVSNQATEVISTFISPTILTHLKIWDYQDLAGEINKFSKESFLDNLEPALNIFFKSQIKFLSDISSASAIYDLKLEDIDQIFINVQTTFSKELRKINNYISFDGKGNKYKEEDLEGSNEILDSNENFIIHGIATSGKTLFLKRIGIKALNQSKAKPNAVFYFDLQNSSNTSLDVDALINDQFKRLTNGDKFIRDDYAKKILLIDGIDFIKDDAIRIKVLTEIEKYLASDTNSNTQVVVATRNLEFLKKNKLFLGFKDTELLPFNFNQALSLVKKIIPNNEQKANNFLKALKNSLLDTTLQRTPLALTLMAILYRDDKIDLRELPANIFELYNRFTDVYLDKWDTSKGISQLYKYEQTKNILAFIALELHKQGVNIINSQELKIFLTDLRKKYNYDELNDIDSFIMHLKSTNGVFHYDSLNDSFAFFNHYFQEFFTSLCIEDDEDSLLIQHFFNSWWSNTLVFYCGKKPKSNNLHKRVLENIVTIDSFQKLHYISQHSKCLQASHDISIDNRNKIVKRLIYEFDGIFKRLSEEGSKNPNSIINEVPFVTLLNQSKTLFESTFSSKHIATAETINFFENLLIEDRSFTNITIYNIAYFLAFHQNSAVPFELFEERIKDDIVWNRILYVDVEFLKLKKKMDEKKFVRIKRKMLKNKFLIQSILQKSIVDKVKKIL